MRGNDIGFGGESVGAGVGGAEAHVVVELPDGFGETPAGAELAAMVQNVPVEQVSGYDTVEYMKGAYKLACHYQGVFLKALLESGIRLPAPDDQIVRAATPDEFASEEARAALVWSRSRAEGTMGRAFQLFGQTPSLGRALVDAAIDEPRANAFSNWTSGLSDAHTERVIDELLPVASQVTVGELIDRIKKLAIALDPEWAERRYRDSVAGRRVELHQTPSGTADLAGRDLPADRARASADRIHTLATSCKTAGDERRIDVIRADLYLGMLDGLFQQMTDLQIVDYVLAHAGADTAPEDEPGGSDDPGDGPSGSSPTHGNEPDGSGSPTPDGQADGDWSPNRDDSPDRRRRMGNSGPGSADSREGNVPSDTSRSSCEARDDGKTSAFGITPLAWNVREMRAELTTVLGLDDHPAELAGVGCVPASVVRSNIARMGTGEWRFVICTEEGYPICSGVTSRRPKTSPRGRRDTRRGGILELQVTTRTIAELAAAAGDGQYAAWASVINDIWERFSRGTLDNDPFGRARQGTPTRAEDYRRRFARAGLRRWVEVRDRYCLHPACRMPASQTDQDHRVDYAAGGLTRATNLDSHCRHDHRLQHEGGWQVTRPRASDPLTGTIVWTSPLGHRYESRPPPVMQAYPEPGDHYPGIDTMPAWFADLAEKSKSHREAAQRRPTASQHEQDCVTSARSTPFPETPPF